MIVIGEKINATRKAVAGALARRDAGYVARLATEQVAAGADYLDLNGGDPDPRRETDNLLWLAEVVQSSTDAPLCIDSANPAAVRAVLGKARHKPIVNSVSLERGRLDSLLGIVGEHECMVIALCMSDEGMPSGADDRAERAGRLIERLTSSGKNPDELIVDPCFVPVSAEPASAVQVCRAIAEILRRFPGVHVGGGVSNVSYGLPGRKHVNLAMLAAAVHHGMDAAIVDPCTPGTVPLMLAAEVLGGADEWCARYIAAHRRGLLR
jgi:5-methyltetrahydrofolate--homocysteine methyltransferase